MIAVLDESSMFRDTELKYIVMALVIKKKKLVTFLGRARVDFQFFFEKVVRFHMFY